MLERDPDADEDLGDRVPYPFPVDPDSDLQQWLAELQAEADDVDGALEDVLDSLQVDNASGRALDEIGTDFGVLGKRRGRDDESYRAFLHGLVAAFDGRGTPPGLRLAIAAGVLADQDDVSLLEDFETQEYEVVLENEAWSSHQSGTVRELADLADPSVVQLRDPVHNKLATVTVETTPGATQTASGSRLEPTAVVMVPGSATKESVSVGLSSAELRSLSSDDWVLSTVKRPSATVLIRGGETQVASMSVSSPARTAVWAGGSTTRPMTRLNPARVGIRTDSSATTLSERGLSSAQLGPLSSGETAELSAI